MILYNISQMVMRASFVLRCFTVLTRICYRSLVPSAEFPIAGKQADGRRDEVVQIKYFFHGSFIARQIRCARDPLVSVSSESTLRHIGLLTNGSRIKADFRDFAIASFRTSSRSPPLSVSGRLPISSRESKKKG